MGEIELNLFKESILCMSHIPGLGSKRIQAIAETIGEGWWSCKIEQFKQIHGIGDELAKTIVRVRDTLDPVKIKDRLVKEGIEFTLRHESQFPKLLEQIPNPPLYMFSKGAIREQDGFAIGIVGTRKPSYYGIEAARYLGQHAGQSNLTVISGMARGIDRYAHESALQAGGRTGAVLAHGLDMIYPREHRMLADTICRDGFLMSEYPPGFPAKPQQFTSRNRIISGLSLCTIVVEAGWKSGALITAEFALEQGREVLAVPGSIFDASSVGTNTLLYDGAIPLRSFEDVLRIVEQATASLNRGHAWNSMTEDVSAANAYDPTRLQSVDEELSEVCKQIVERTPATGVGVHDLVNCIPNLSLSQFHLMLLQLEVSGWITRQGDRIYRKRMDGLS